MYSSTACYENPLLSQFKRDLPCPFNWVPLQHGEIGPHAYVIIELLNISFLGGFCTTVWQDRN